MAFLRGVEVGKIIKTEADVIEFCYPEYHKRLQAQKSSPKLASAQSVVIPPPPAPAQPPVVIPPSSPPPTAIKTKSKKKVADDEVPETLPEVPEVKPEPEPEVKTGYDIDAFPGD